MPPDPVQPLRVDPARLNLIGEGGTRWVYAHPARPGFVLKRFKAPPPPDHLGLLVGNSELAGYLVGASRFVEADVVQPGGTSRETLVEQPFLDVRRAISLHVRYWELADGVPAAALRLRDPGVVAAAFAELEPPARTILDGCAGDADFRAALDRFLACAAAYVARTGLILDLVGHRNLIAVPPPGRRIELLDGLKGDPLSPPVRDSGPPDLRETVQLLNVAAFYRMTCFLETATGTRSFPPAFHAHAGAALDRLGEPAHRSNLDSARRFQAAARPGDLAHDAPASLVPAG